MIKNKVIFNTQRLVIRLLSHSDLPNYYDMVSDVEVMKYIKQPLNFNESKKELSNFISYYEDKEHFKIWCVNKKSGKDLIGICGYYLNDKDEYEIAYRLRHQFWKKGFGFEIGEGLINYLLQNVKLPKLTAYVMNENTKSIKVLENLGFKNSQFVNDKENLEYKYELINICY